FACKDNRYWLERFNLACSRGYLIVSGTLFFSKIVIHTGIEDLSRYGGGRV
nr:hypothetical protein [Tanacetum cinerariifolium]